MRRAIVLLALLCVSGCSDDTPTSTAPPESGRFPGDVPNVVFLVAERFDALDFEDEGTLGKHPGLARLVTEGSRFANAFAPTSSPQHAAFCLETGKRPGAGPLTADLLEALGTSCRFMEREGPEFLDAVAADERFFLRVSLNGTSAEQRSRLDVLLTALFARLEEKGIAGDTLIVFTSASAAITDEPPLSDEALRVPLVFWSPGRIPANEIRQQLVTHSDLPVTLRELLGADVPETDGGSFASLLQKRRQSWRDHVVFEDAADGEWKPMGRAFRTKNWKYVRSSKGTESFYALRSDAREQDDVLERPQLAQFLESNRTRLADWVAANAR